MEQSGLKAHGLQVKRRARGGKETPTHTHTPQPHSCTCANNTHLQFAHLVLIEVGVEQLAVGGVDDGGAVAGSKHVRRAVAGEGLQQDGLGAQRNALALATKVGWEVGVGGEVRLVATGTGSGAGAGAAVAGEGLQQDMLGAQRKGVGGATGVGEAREQRVMHWWTGAKSLSQQLARTHAAPCLNSPTTANRTSAPRSPHPPAS